MSISPLLGQLLPRDQLERLVHDIQSAKQDQDSQCGPYTTNGAGHMRQVDGDEHVGVTLLAADTDRLPPRARGHICVVYSHVDCVSAQAVESIVLCGTLVHVLNEAMGGVTSSIEVHLVDEVRPLVIVHQQIIRCVR